MANRRPPIAVTPALLHQAWQLRTRPDWPPTLEACMAHPVYRRLLRAQAIGLGLQQPQARQIGTAQPAPTLHTTQLGRLQTRQAPAAEIDRKRAAAGDRDD